MAHFLVNMQDGTTQSIIADGFELDQNNAMRFIRITDGTTVGYVASGQLKWIVNLDALPTPPAVQNLHALLRESLVRPTSDEEKSP